jgi:hypothetical protein
LLLLLLLLALVVVVVVAVVPTMSAMILVDARCCSDVCRGDVCRQGFALGVRLW